MSYPEFPDSVTDLEESVLETWRTEDTFRRTLEATRGKEPFVFFEGPPTANGRPGLHHVVSRAIKDLVCRYWTMRGRHVTRIAGWDAHGLPVEIEAQRRLGIEDKKEIEERGIGWFNRRCRESVFAYKEEWERFSERIGYWLDYSRPYVTFDARYVESVWWLLKRMADRGLLYRGHKVAPWCPKDQTVLSSHETSLGYRDAEDPSLWIEVELLDGSDRRLLVWTTTPWTLVSNVALAVNPALEYVEVDRDGRRLVLARARAKALFGSDVARRTVPVADLLGASYRRPFELIPTDGAAGRMGVVVAADFVSDAEGSGVVHLAPAYGADDHRAGKELGLAMLEPLGPDGRFPRDVPLIGGLFFKDADEPLIRDLKARGLVFRATRETHSYPHCWRCGAPLVYMARHSWFAATSSLRDELLANNDRISWRPPEVGEGRFGEWLKGNVDWALSRDRYWGTPLPVWISEEDPERVQWIGSFEELAAHAGELPPDFDPHRPYIDEVSWTCPETGAAMRRAPEVLDVWFDSGAMPWAQWHYPFENRERFERHFPADFICEAVDQTRGWFYSLHAISTMLGLGPAFRNVVVNDLILDSSGRKMSKSKGNVVDPWEAVAEHGADGLRWYMVTVSNPWLPTAYDPAGVREAGSRFFGTLSNLYRFFSLYANVEGWTPPSSRSVSAPGFGSALDRWLMSRLHGLIGSVREELDAYNPTRAYRAVAAFVDEDLSNWYVRRSRPRFWGNADEADGEAAFATLHEALRVTALLIAPVTPFASDWLHRALTGRSSHTEPFPELDPDWIDEALDLDVACVRRLSRLARAAREEVGIRVRQPLGRLLAVAPERPPGPAVLDLLRDEVNVKEIAFASSADDVVALTARPSFRALGRRFGKRTQEAAAAVRALAADDLRRVRGGGTARIEVEGEAHRVGCDDMEIREEARPGWVVRSEGASVVALDPTLTGALRREGLAREVVNRVQRLRRESALDVADRVELAVGGAEAVCRAVREHRAWIAGETLATRIAVDAKESAERFEHRRTVELDGDQVVLGLARVE